jgi:spore maturation protein CgeB
MKIVVFGLTISSSWGNGHATLWRGLCKALARRNCSVTFFERDVPYYAAARDFEDIPGGDLVLYQEWNDIEAQARAAVADADAAIITSYCPDSTTVAERVVLPGRALKVFYDLDTPVTLAALARGESIAYIGSRQLGDFDLVFSYTGGIALTELVNQLGARRVVPLFGHVDPEVHRPVEARPHYRSDLCYLATYSADRQARLEQLLLHPARECPQRRFLIGGAQYPENFPWSKNIYFLRHLPAAEHPGFFCSSRLTLNVTRAAMSQMGWCPSGRLFEATACGVPVLSDCWEGLDAFFKPGSEILLARFSTEAIDAIQATDAELARIAQAGRERTLAQHTSDNRAEEMLAALTDVRSSRTSKQMAEA